MGKANMANEQAVIWLHNMVKDPDIFNSVNAENALALIRKLQIDNTRLGKILSIVKKQRDSAYNLIHRAVESSDDRDIWEHPNEYIDPETGIRWSEDCYANEDDIYEGGVDE